MMPLAALVFGSSLIVTAGPVDPVDPPPPDPRAVKRAARAERRRHTMAVVKTVTGVGMEVGSALLYLVTADSLIARDVNLPPAGCSAPDKPPAQRPCYAGTPVVLLFPVGAVGLGWAGATFLAAGRDASIWRSPLFWAGTGVQLATSALAIVVAGRADTRNQQLFADTTFIAGALAGTVMEVWGAGTAPLRHVETVETVEHAPRLAPACGPTAGGVVCGLALAGF
jgi:hypothetical protein